MKHSEYLILKHCLALPALALLAALLCGCYADRSPAAVETAREYALDHLRDLNEIQRNYIRYTDPQIYENVIFPAQTFKLGYFNHLELREPRGGSLPRSPQLDYMHSCVVWSPPGLGAKVVVVGESERSMRFWSPKRLLIKNYIPKNMALENASARATTHAMNNMLFLTDNERNRIRFSEPEVLVTEFDIAPKEEESTGNWEEYLNSLKEEDVPVQISLVWKGDKEQEMIVFSGFAKDDKLTEWNIKNARYLSRAELDKHTIKRQIAGGTVTP